MEAERKDGKEAGARGQVLRIGDVVPAAARRSYEGQNGIWRAVLTGPGAEAKVAEGLGRFGVATYVPCETLWRAAKGRKAQVQRPLIRGYVFALLPAGAGDLLHEVAGATRFLSWGDTPATLSPGFVYALIAEERAGRYDTTRLPRDKVKGLAARRRQGERVTVTQGPYAGFAATVMKLKPRRRVEVMIELIGRTVRKELDLGKLEAA